MNRTVTRQSKTFTAPPKIFPLAGIGLMLGSSVLIIWLYARAPQSFSEAVQSVKQGAQVAANVYQVDEAAFEQGLKLFRADNFVAARDEFARADPLARDARTQFYIAYSFYRQGWGRFYSDDALYKQALETLRRVDELNPALRVADPDGNLQLSTPAELRAELQAGLERTVSDFNPMRLTRERK